ncbi:hypothetical protein E2C01_083720 [Portunus trituberculatus]|uniref:Uncharacterized protein n=1 Tax=Portunus trituberculatus TaxID=210409 RepID=A0A5B7J2F5_PORTR|nr:hypothetical protein [Portunus trituberculatus]
MGRAVEEMMCLILSRLELTAKKDVDSLLLQKVTAVVDKVQQEAPGKLCQLQGSPISSPHNQRANLVTMEGRSDTNTTRATVSSSKALIPVMECEGPPLQMTPGSAGRDRERPRRGLPPRDTGTSRLQMECGRIRCPLAGCHALGNRRLHAASVT